jgi:hypothetical protein
LQQEKEALPTEDASNSFILVDVGIVEINKGKSVYGDCEGVRMKLKTADSGVG